MANGIFKAHDVDFRESSKKIANNTLYYYVSEKMFILLRNCKAWLRSQAFNKGNPG